VKFFEQKLMMRFKSVIFNALAAFRAVAVAELLDSQFAIEGSTN
jgi:hypothetical protein